MHDQDIKDAIFMAIFNDEEIYRKHYIPTMQFMVKNPKKATDRLKELVDNITMKFCKKNNLNYTDIPSETKDELTIDLYNEIIENEVNRSR